MLAAPEPDDPQDGVVANEYKTDNEKWKRTAKLWTEQYASEKGDKEALAPLLEMGFSEDQVLPNLSNSKILLKLRCSVLVLLPILLLYLSVWQLPGIFLSTLFGAAT